MKEKMAKMLAKKRDLHPAEKKAKMDVVKDLKDLASSAMSDKMDGLKKVSVMSNSKEGLKHGLEKAGQIVSGDEMDQMKDHAENALGDYKSAMEEHNGDENNQEDGWINDENRYADGGEVEQDPQKMQDAQQSMRDAFHYNEGGEVPELEESPDKGDYDSVDAEDNNDKSEELSPDQGEYSDVDQESPAEHEDDSDDEDNEFHGLDMKDLDDKLEKLMKLKKKMESR
jgi:hypothetical protein